MSQGRVVSVNVGQPRPLRIGDRNVQTGIFKESVASGARLGREGFEGDVQVDRRVHGGPEQAAYVYSLEHYAYWKEFLGKPDLPWGYFGENLTVDGMSEAAVHIGDVWSIGQARVRVTRPRGPCSTLATRVGRPHYVKEFLATRRLGSYLAVVEEGLVRPGDAVARLERLEHSVSMAELIRALYDEDAPAELLQRVLAAPAVAEKHRERVAHRQR